MTSDQYDKEQLGKYVLRICLLYETNFVKLAKYKLSQSF